MREARNTLTVLNYLTGREKEQREQLLILSIIKSANQSNIREKTFQLSRDIQQWSCCLETVVLLLLAGETNATGQHIPAETVGAVPAAALPTLPLPSLPAARALLRSMQAVCSVSYGPLKASAACRELLNSTSYIPRKSRSIV